MSCERGRKILPIRRNDIKRLLQCFRCANDPEKCGCTEADEDENGMCKKYEEARWSV